MPRNKEVSGYVESVSSRPSRFGSFDHTIQLNKKYFRLFNDADICLLKKGDLVKFSYISTGRKYKYYKINELSIEIVNPMENAKYTKGFVYILSNPSMPDLLKIGFTTRSPEERARELYNQSTGIPKRFKVEWSIFIAGDPQLVEKKVHAELKDYKHGKEFFKINLDAAQYVVEEAYKDLYPESAIQEEDAKKIIQKRQSKIDKRRKILRQELKEKQEAIENERKQKEYEKSNEYKWLTQGNVTYSTRKLSGSRQTHFNIFEKLFKDKPSPFLDIELICYDITNYDVSYSDDPFWRIYIRGIDGWDGIWESSGTPGEGEFTLKDALLMAENYYNRYPFDNIGFSLRVKVACIENKEIIPVPDNYWHNVVIDDLSQINIKGLPEKSSLMDLIDTLLPSLPSIRVNKFKKAILN